MAIDLKVALGAKVRGAREIRGISQEKLAELIGRTPETISNIERGKTMPGVDTIHALCSSLGLALADLFSDQDQGRDPDRIAAELRSLQMLRALTDEDLEIAEKTIEALYRRLKR